MRSTAPSIYDTDWMLQAKCRDHPNPDLWHGETAAQRAEAAKECKTCPVLAECCIYSAAIRPHWGVWAGKDCEKSWRWGR